MSARTPDLLVPTPAGLYCPDGDFYIDPTRQVERALITHGHSDHARAGHGAVLATPPTHSFMSVRHGEDYCRTRQPAAYGDPLTINGVEVTFYPAGHILGSAQIAVRRGGRRIVVSGDFKRQSDPTCREFEVISCDVFITEATFALPIFKFPPAAAEIDRLLASLRLFGDRPHHIGAYSLGKAQRVIAELRSAGYDRPIGVSLPVAAICGAYGEHGVDLGDLSSGQITVGPAGAGDDSAHNGLAAPIRAFASGWTCVRGRDRQPGFELALIISDHADWAGLCATILDCQASEIWVTHGDGTALVHWCGQQGISARPLDAMMERTR
jgi:putative mRNA 3-end processing factor